jgi:hypothetical protein
MVVLANERVVEARVVAGGRTHILLGPSETNVPNAAIGPQDRPLAAIPAAVPGKQGEAIQGKQGNRSAPDTARSTNDAREAATANLDAEYTKVAEIEVSLRRIKADLEAISPRSLRGDGKRLPCGGEPAICQVAESVVSLDDQIAALWGEMNRAIRSLHGPVLAKSPEKNAQAATVDGVPRARPKVSAEGNAARDVGGRD